MLLARSFSALSRAPLGVALAVLAGACSPESGVSGADGSGPAGAVDRMGKLVARSPSVDFGRVFEGEVLERRFEFAVEGPGPVRIVSVRRSCGCQRAELVLAETGEPYATGEDLEPGTVLWLESSFETLGRTGEQTKSLGLYGDFAGGAVEVSLHASVQPLLALDPDPLNLGEVLLSEGSEGSIELRLVDGFEKADRVWLEIGEGAATEGLDLRLEAVEPAPDGSSDRFRLHVATRVGGVPGYYNHRVPLRARVEADGEALYSSEAHVLAHVLGLAEAQPPSLSFRSLGADQVSATTGRIVVRGELPDLAGVEPTWTVQCGDVEIAEHFSVEIEPAESDTIGTGASEYRVTVRTSGLPTDVRGPFRGRLVLPLGQAAQQELVIGLHGVALGG